MEAKNKLDMLLEYSGMKILPFSKHVKQGSQTFYDIRSGKIQTITADVANKIVAGFPEINKEWLIGGDPQMFKKVDRFRVLLDDVPEPIVYPSAADQLIKVTDKKKRQKEGITPIEKDAYMWVEYQDLSAVAGRLGGANVDALPEHKKKLVPNEYDSGSYLVVRVDGDSMQTDSEISIPNGSEILIKEHIFQQGEKLPIRDNLWVIVSREGTVFKQIIDHNVEQQYITVHSYNPRFKDYDIMMEDVIQLFLYRKIVSSRPRIPDITK